MTITYNVRVWETLGGPRPKWAGERPHCGQTGGKYQADGPFHGNYVLIKIKLQTMTVQKTETHIELAYIESMVRG